MHELSKANTQRQNRPISKAPSHLWHKRAEELKWLSLTYIAEAPNAFEIISQKGGLFHDAFGRVLEHVDPCAFKKLWRPDFNNELYPQFNADSPPKAFALNPPDDRKTVYKAGERFSINLVLFGNASAHARACSTAIYKIGQFGLGNTAATYQVTDCQAQHIASDAIAEQFYKRHGRALKQLASDDVGLGLTLHLNSPAYFKQNGRRLYQAPDFHYLLARIIYRANWVSVCSGKGVLISDAMRQLLMEQAAQVSTVCDNTQVKGWQRYSVSRNKWMRFDGLSGQISYANVPANLVPLLDLAAAANLGGKTSFGMGKISWSLQ